MDIVHIAMGYYNIFLQLHKNEDGTYNTWELHEKLVMITVVVTSLMQTFFFMRIVGSFSYIVTMIISVISDLKVFMIFFFTLMVMLSAVLAVIFCPTADEYEKIGPFFGGIVTTIRLSLGDFDFDILTKDVHNGGLNTKQHFLYWIVWLLIIIFSCLIFLNFIIAEVSNSYTKVNDKLAATIVKERAKLIDEAEDLLTMEYKKEKKLHFPRFIVHREMEK